MKIEGEEADFKEPFLSGYFRDGKRRIDLIIVSKETKKKSIETTKMDFLLGVINTGLDLELETGVNSAVSDLLFIKVHAPDHLIKHFGYYYNMRKFFKKSHMDIIHSNVLEEVELIKVIRRWYPGPVNYSTFERSVIVYKILLSVSFGSPANHIGINQLIENNVFLDVYPLHDGPYHTLFEQSPLQLNGRQALYYNWLGYKNVFRCQPINLVREYLGERTAFYFAFYGFYNTFLLVLAIVGAVVFKHNYNFKHRNITLNEYGEPNTYIYPKTKTDYPDLPVCPKCKDFVACPFRNLSDFTRELKGKVLLDNPYNYYFALFVVIWGILLYTFWRRRENYHYWIWETTEDDAHSLVRPEYRQLPKPRKRAESSTGPQPKKGEKVITARVRSETTSSESKMAKILPTIAEFVVITIALVFIVGHLCLLISLKNKMLNKIRYVEDLLYAVITDGKEQFNHFVVDFVGSINGVTILALEYAWFKVAKWLIRFLNPKTEWDYEAHLVLSLYGVTLLINFGLIFFFAFFKGALFRYPDDGERWTIPLGLGMMNCGVLSCIDEIFIVFVATHKVKKCIQEVMCIFENRHRARVKDIMEKRYEGEQPFKTPCWEREFELAPLTEDFFMEKYNELFLQLAVTTLLVTVFPLTPLIAFIWNLFEIRHQAAVVLLYSRRPLVVQSWGLGGWRIVLFLMPYFAAITNSLYLVRSNSALHRKYNEKYWSHEAKRRFIADYYLGFRDLHAAGNNSPAFTKDFNMYWSNFRNNVPEFCMYPGKFVLPEKIQWHPIFQMVGKYAPENFYIYWHQALVVLFYMYLSIFVGVIFHAVIKPISKRVYNYQYIEDSVKVYDIKKEMAKIARRIEAAKED